MGGYLSTLHRWGGRIRSGGAKAPKPPRPHPHRHVTAYQQRATVRLADYRAGYVRLKVKDGVRWEWENFRAQAPPSLDSLQAECDRERERIAVERAEQNWRRAAEGRKARTEAERRILRPTPGVWVGQSPTLVVRRDGWWHPAVRQAGTCAMQSTTRSR